MSVHDDQDHATGYGHEEALRTVPWETIFLTATLTGLAAGGLGSLVGAHQPASVAWALTTLLGAVAAAWWVVEGLRQGRLGVDVIALLALCGALVVHEELAGAVISVMVATGRTLEGWAAGHARRELRTLLERALHQANRYGVDGLETVALEVLGGDDPLGPMIRAHAEISHLVRRLGRLLDDLDPEAPGDDDIAELRRLLYGLHAILRLHTTQEDESYLSIAEPETAGPA